MARYLVTGGAGFIGSHLATALVERGDQVRVLDDLSAGRRENLAHLKLGPEGSGAPLELLVGSVTDPALARRACRGVAGVFHEAAQVSVPQSLEEPEKSYEINVTGTLRMLEAARLEGVGRFVFAASSSAYGDTSECPEHEGLAPRPLSPYASGKLAGEHLLAVWGRLYGMRTVALRYFNVFGPRQADDSPYSGVIAIFATRLLSGKPITIHGDGQQTRDFVYVANVVRANLAAMDAQGAGAGLEPGAVFNVGCGTSVTILELYDELARLTGVRMRPAHGPARAGDVLHSRASIERIRAGLGWSPSVGLREGLERTVEWYRQRLAATAR
jgi:UDP-glucose 4-epimerase